MNNGQTQNPQGQPNQSEFFTAGVGANSPDANPDGSNIETSAFQSIPVEDPNRQATKSNLGSTALNTPNSTESISAPGAAPNTPSPMPLPESNPTEKLGTIYDYDLNKPPIIEDKNAVQNNPALNKVAKDPKPETHADKTDDGVNLGELACVADGVVDKGDISTLDKYVNNATNPDEMADQVAEARLEFNKKEAA